MRKRKAGKELTTIQPMCTTKVIMGSHAGTSHDGWRQYTVRGRFEHSDEWIVRRDRFGSIGIGYIRECLEQGSVFAPANWELV